MRKTMRSRGDQQPGQGGWKFTFNCRTARLDRGADPRHPKLTAAGWQARMCALGDEAFDGRLKKGAMFPIHGRVHCSLRRTEITNLSDL
jgi:hypothetical protein